MPSTPSPFSASTTQDAAAQALAGGWASCCFNSGSTEKSFDGDAKVLLLEFRKLSPHLQKVWRTLKSSSDLTKILPEGVVVNPSGRVIKLSLYKKELDGEISPLVGQLTELKSLNLAKKIPPWWDSRVDCLLQTLAGALPVPESYGRPFSKLDWQAHAAAKFQCPL
jgi:hypothetical protein